MTGLTNENREESPVRVIGMGNPILTDDGVGVRIVRRLKERLDPRHGAVVEEEPHGGFRLMERLIGCDRAVIVDAIQTGAPPGSLFELTLDDLPTAHRASSHDVDLPAALVLGRHAGARLPADDAIRLVAVEAEDVTTFSERCTPAVEAVIDRAADYVLTRLADVAEWGPIPAERAISRDPLERSPR